MLNAAAYLLHVPVVHGVVRHFVRLQLNDLLQFIAVAFPLAHYDHFIKQEYVPWETKRKTPVSALNTCSPILSLLMTSLPHSLSTTHSVSLAFITKLDYSPVLLCSVDYGGHLELAIYLWSAILLQFDLLLGSHIHMPGLKLESAVRNN